MVAQRRIDDLDRPRETPAGQRYGGDAYVLLYRLPREVVVTGGFVPRELEASYRGGTGAVLLVDAVTSDAGPCQELLFIPGRFQHEDRGYYSVTRGFVSTAAGQASGCFRLGQPLEIAEFQREQRGNVERVRVEAEGRTVADLAFVAGRFGLPMTTDFVPAAARTLLQAVNGREVFSTASGSATFRRARCVAATFDGVLFPDLAPFEPRMTLAVKGFDVVFS
jgi:hypothetical protein